MPVTWQFVVAFLIAWIVLLVRATDQSMRRRFGGGIWHHFRLGVAYTFLAWAMQVMPNCQEKADLVHHILVFVKWKAKEEECR